MKTQAFYDGLLSAKLMLLVGKVLEGDPTGHKLSNKIRAHVENAIVLMALRPEPDQDAKIAEYLDYLSATIFDEFSEIDLELLVKGEATSTGGRIREIRQTLSSLLAGVATGDIPGQAAGEGLNSLKPLGRHKDRDSLLSDFGSLVRNDEWLSMFMALGLDVTAGKLTGYQEYLTRTYGSPEGKLAIPQKIARFIDVTVQEPSARKGVKSAKAKAAEAERLKAADVVIVTVALDAPKLIQLPRTRELSVDFHDITPRISDLLSAAALPVRLSQGQTAEGVAQQKLDDFYAGLDKRGAAVEAARERAAQSTLESKKAKAVAALRDLGPLAQILKENPELLNQV